MILMRSLGGGWVECLGQTIRSGTPAFSMARRLIEQGYPPDAEVTVIATTGTPGLVGTLGAFAALTVEEGSGHCRFVPYKPRSSPVEGPSPSPASCYPQGRKGRPARRILGGNAMSGAASIRPCDWCARDFLPGRAFQLYCTPLCSRRACWTRWHNGETVERTLACAWCGATFVTRRRNGRFCRAECGRSYHARRLAA